MNENLKTIIIQNKTVFIATLNKFLDTYYEENNENKEDENAILYEDLRKKIINEEDLSDLNISLLLILLSYQINKFKNLEQQYKFTHEQLTLIQDQIQLNFKK